MTYTRINYKTKKALKDAIAEGKEIHIYEPGPFAAPTDGVVYLEGPHFPEPHRWYGKAVVQNGLVIKVT